MAFGLKRTDLQALAQSKIDDAILLLQHKRFSNAYYLAGYAVEIGLKACIAKQYPPRLFPIKRYLQKYSATNFQRWSDWAGSQRLSKSSRIGTTTFAANWAIVGEWSPDARYETQDPAATQIMLAAVTTEQSGVLPWIKQYW
jgi:hypothetical protein